MIKKVERLEEINFNRDAYKMVIFDIDGTISKKSLVYSVFQSVLAKYNLELNINEEIGVGKIRLNQDWIKNYFNIDLELSQRIYRNYKKHFNRLDGKIFMENLYSDVFKTFYSLNELNINIGIITLREQKLAKTHIKKCGLMKFISKSDIEIDRIHITGSTLNKTTKKLNAAANKKEQLNYHLENKPRLMSNDFLVIGDSEESDIAPALELGMNSILITRK